MDDAGNGRIYRNHYVCDPEPDIDALIALGLMADRGAQPMYGGMHIYHVTDAGRKVVMDSRPVLPKLSRSQKRYRDFLNADLGCSFGEFLKMKLTT